MTQEQIAELRRDIDQWKPTNDLALKLIDKLIGAIEAAQQEIADLKRGGVVVPEIPTWEDGENKLRRGETLTALEKFVMDHDWNKMDASFRDGLEAVFAELRANLRTIPADRVLGEGDARIGMNELQMLRCFAGRRMSEREYDRLEAVRDAHEEALRTNQGGAEHV